MKNLIWLFWIKKIPPNELRRLVENEIEKEKREFQDYRERKEREILNPPIIK